MEYRSKHYINRSRWTSFYEQFCIIRELDPRNILEIGLGSRILYAILKEFGFKITGFDNDSRLEPDILGDVKNIRTLFRDGQFDCVCCFQVLEHIPFSEFEGTMENIAKVTSKYAVISLPYAGYSLGAEVRLSRVGERKAGLVFRIPSFWNKHRFDGKHYWEIGKRGYSLSKIQAVLLKYYKIKKRIMMAPNKNCIFFLLEKNGTH